MKKEVDDRYFVDIKVRVQPRSSKRRIEIKDDVVKVWVCSPAVEDRANKELIDFIAETFKIKKRNVKILGGKKGRNKLIRIIVSNNKELERLKNTLKGGI